MVKTPESIEAFDRMQRGLILQAAERGEDLAKAMERIKEQTRAPYLRLLRVEQEATADNNLPVFPIRFPAPERDPAA